MEKHAPADIALEDHDLVSEATASPELVPPTSAKPKGTIPMPLPRMSEDPAFVPEHSEQQAKWFENKAEWERAFKRSAEAALRKSFPDATITVTDFRSLQGEKDELGLDRGYDENDFEIEFQCGRRGDRIGEGGSSVQRWRVRRVTEDALQP